MSRYIDADELIKSIDKEIFTNPTTRSYFKQIVHKQPTADVVEVVRCKNCEYSELDENGNTWSTFYNGKIREMPNGYCWHGERKEE